MQWGYPVVLGDFFAHQRDEKKKVRRLNAESVESERNMKLQKLKRKRARAKEE